MVITGSGLIPNIVSPCTAKTERQAHPGRRRDSVSPVQRIEHGARGGLELSDIDTRSERGNAGFEAVLTASAYRNVLDRIPGAEIRRTTVAVLSHPAPVTREIADLARRLADIARGIDDGRNVFDRRFADPAWQENPVLRRVAMSYLASCASVESILSDTDVDWRTRERMALLVDNLLAAAAPTNNPLLNPRSLKRAFDTRGASWVRGIRNLVSDLRSPPRIPSMVDETKFTMGDNIAAQPGKVVRRGELYELIQFDPVTEMVDEVPVFLISSPVNKYYLVDLSPEGSVIGAALARGRQVFVASWVNPDERHAALGLDAYVRAVLDGLDTITDITGSESVHVVGLCGGGLIALATAGYLAIEANQQRLVTLTVGICVVDYEQGGLAGALLDRKTADRAIKRATEDGYFDGKNSATAFAWMRPNDGIWASFVNNFLLGEDPPAVELLYWAADQTNLPVQFGREMLEIVLTNGFTTPGGVRVLGRPIDLREVTVDTYLVGASTDHITPWLDCYRTRALLGGETTFVLARGGHALAIASPPGTKRASYRTSTSTSTVPDEWLKDSTDNPGSWWENWHDWIEKRTPASKPAPRALGSDTYPPLAAAPGEYVRRRLT
jgi:polyhydroxyalkanoate synthase subunit PhaC